ncbi:hypothetical protein ACTXT7_000426 [Hymenolepis weldensis]
MIRERVKMANLTRDSALIDSDAVSTLLTQLSKRKNRHYKPASKFFRLNTLLTIFCINTQQSVKYVNLENNKNQVLRQLDTTSFVTITSTKLWNSLGCLKLEPASPSAISACGGSVKLTGKLSCNVALRDNYVKTTAHAADFQLNLIALDWPGTLGPLIYL